MGLMEKGFSIKHLNLILIAAMPTKIVDNIPLFHHSIIPMHRQTDIANK